MNAGLLEASAAPLADGLAAIPYSSAILLMLVYEREALGHALDGFGFLVPRSERKTIAAATWVNTKFPSSSKTRPRSFAGLRRWCNDALELAHAPEARLSRWCVPIIKD